MFANYIIVVLSPGDWAYKVFAKTRLDNMKI